MPEDSFESLIKKAFDAVDNFFDQKLNPDETSGNPASESNKTGRKTAHSINRSDETDYTDKMNSFYAVCARVYNPKNTRFEPGSYPYRKYEKDDKKPRLLAIKACIPEAHSCLPLLKPGEKDYNAKLEFLPTFYSDKPFVQRPGLDEYVKVTFGDMDNNLDGIFLTSDYRAIEGTRKFKELPSTAVTTLSSVGAEYPEVRENGRDICKARGTGAPWKDIRSIIKGKPSSNFTTRSDHANVVSPDPLLVGKKITSYFYDDCKQYIIPTRTNFAELTSRCKYSDAIHNDWATYRYDPVLREYRYHAGTDVYPQRGGRYVSVPYPEKTIFKRVDYAPNKGNGFLMYLDHEDYRGDFEMKLVHLGSETLKWILVYCFGIPEDSIQMFEPKPDDISFMIETQSGSTSYLNPASILDELTSNTVSSATGTKLRIPYWPVAPKGKSNAYRLYRSDKKGKGTTGTEFFKNRNEGQEFQKYINLICDWINRQSTGGRKFQDQGKTVKIGTIIRPKRFISGSKSHLHLAVRTKSLDSVGNPVGKMKWGNPFALMDVSKLFARFPVEYSTEP